MSICRGRVSSRYVGQDAGTAQESLLGTPASHGCVRMGSADLIELFGQVGVGTRVHIAE
ncbi:L,D-transpeptidase [Bordetella sp. 2513F-2]